MVEPTSASNADPRISQMNKVPYPPLSPFSLIVLENPVLNCSRVPLPLPSPHFSFRFNRECRKAMSLSATYKEIEGS